ncbi:hypothetical protein [Anaplasma phagocytophilum]|uniref:hypothetical protein n=1 Tax=Anaplasma phagocytophilum TaxID=948 RepID=UPI0007DFBDC5|nr:hypothetical protein [Anaplasma phagocytophilum]SBO33205.1 hypothetical protein ANAPC2_01284 [Anaplasma phagocytophilum]SBO33664.1 hypothetical protein ANAPC3_01311 [Anaplasma phagocytophilum]SBO33874.1 hypothetical protein ANAPC4_01335 [Anaplasma phagocytophilum]
MMSIVQKSKKLSRMLYDRMVLSSLVILCATKSPSEYCIIKSIFLLGAVTSSYNDAVRNILRDEEYPDDHASGESALLTKARNKLKRGLYSVVSFSKKVVLLSALTVLLSLSYIALTALTILSLVIVPAVSLAFFTVCVMVANICLVFKSAAYFLQNVYKKVSNFLSPPNARKRFEEPSLFTADGFMPYITERAAQSLLSLITTGIAGALITPLIVGALGLAVAFPILSLIIIPPLSACIPNTYTTSLVERISSGEWDVRELSNIGDTVSSHCSSHNTKDNKPRPRSVLTDTVQKTSSLEQEVYKSYYI